MEIWAQPAEDDDRHGPVSNQGGPQGAKNRRRADQEPGRAEGALRMIGVLSTASTSGLADMPQLRPLRLRTPRLAALPVQRPVSQIREKAALRTTRGSRVMRTPVEVTDEPVSRGVRSYFDEPPAGGDHRPAERWLNLDRFNAAVSGIGLGGLQAREMVVCPARQAGSCGRPRSHINAVYRRPLRLRSGWVRDRGWRRLRRLTDGGGGVSRNYPGGTGRPIAL